MKSQFKPTVPSLSKQKGFTVLELIVVVVVLGILAIIGAKQFSNAGVSDASKAHALFEAATKLSSNAVLLAQAAGTSPVAAGNTMAKTGQTLMDILVLGQTSFDDTKYPNAYVTAGVSPMPSLVQGSAGKYKVAGYSVTMGGGDLKPHSFAFADVPDGVIQMLVAKYGSSESSLKPAGDSTNPVIQYGTPTAGLRTVTILRPL